MPRTAPNSSPTCSQPPDTPNCRNQNRTTASSFLHERHRCPLADIRDVGTGHALGRAGPLGTIGQTSPLFSMCHQVSEVSENRLRQLRPYARGKTSGISWLAGFAYRAGPCGHRGRRGLTIRDQVDRRRRCRCLRRKTRSAAAGAQGGEAEPRWGSPGGPGSRARNRVQ
jgi:hypothetical protein